MDSLFGVETDVTVRTAVSCDECEGVGTAPGTSVSTCEDCNGAGEVRAVRNTVLGQIVSASPCRRCSGLGEVINDPCT
ncbi:MAG: hypothetical protein M5U19_08295 [Microthrixaceae bacterium]|nr:hypothetical protein [Microthrixaceae bacterium]